MFSSALEEEREELMRIFGSDTEAILKPESGSGDF
jgi:hypothetical protein